MVNVRFTYATDPLVFHPNGLKVDKSCLPSSNSLKYFVNGVLDKAFVAVNPPKHHKSCSSLCGQPVQVLIGWPHGADVISSVTTEVKQLVYNADKYGRCGQPPKTLESQVLQATGLTRDAYYAKARQKLETRSADGALQVKKCY